MRPQKTTWLEFILAFISFHISSTLSVFPDDYEFENGVRGGKRNALVPVKRHHDQKRLYPGMGTSLFQKRLAYSPTRWFDADPNTLVTGLTRNPVFQTQFKTQHEFKKRPALLQSGWMDQGLPGTGLVEKRKPIRSQSYRPSRLLRRIDQTAPLLIEFSDPGSYHPDIAITKDSIGTGPTDYSGLSDFLFDTKRSHDKRKPIGPTDMDPMMPLFKRHADSDTKARKRDFKGNDENLRYPIFRRSPEKRAYMQQNMPQYVYYKRQSGPTNTNEAVSKRHHTSDYQSEGLIPQYMANIDKRSGSIWANTMKRFDHNGIDTRSDSPARSYNKRRHGVFTPFLMDQRATPNDPEADIVPMTKRSGGHDLHRREDSNGAGVGDPELWGMRFPARSTRTSRWSQVMGMSKRENGGAPNDNTFRNEPVTEWVTANSGGMF